MNKIPGSAGLQPCLIYIHGGGFVAGSVNSTEVTCYLLHDVLKFTVISIEYRLAPEHRFPAGVEDCFNAILWIMNNARKYHIDNQNLWIGGDSAGGNLSAVSCIRLRQHELQGKPLPGKIRGQILVYPVINLDFETESDARKNLGKTGVTKGLSAESMRFFEALYVTKEEDRKNPLASPIFQPDLSGLPPALIITAEYDILRDEAEIYGEKLRKQGVEIVVKRYKEALHGFFYFKCLETNQAMELIKIFVDHVLKAVPLEHLASKL